MKDTKESIGVLERNPKELHNSNMSDDRVSPYPLRMPAEMRECLEKIAKDSGRSLHAEIMARLEESFEPLPITPEDLLRVIENKIKVSTQPAAEFMLRWASVAVEQKAFIDENKELFEQVIKGNPDIAFLPAIEEVKKLLNKK